MTSQRGEGGEGEEERKKTEEKKGRCLLAATFFEFWRESLVSFRAVLPGFFRLFLPQLDRSHFKLNYSFLRLIIHLTFI